jgi:hypothetical protein
MKVKHSKYKNTGVIFESIVRQITKDSLEGKNSPAKNLLSKYFTKTELGNEYKLYEALVSKNNLTEGKAESILNVLIESYKGLNKGVIKRQKFNLIKEIKESYDLNLFFSHNIPNYKIYASFYTLLELNSTTKISSLGQNIQSKLNLIEYLTSSNINNKPSNSLFEDYSNESKEIRILAYRLLIERFNEKYSNLYPSQKEILKKLITSSPNSKELKDFYITQTKSLKENLQKLNTKTQDPATKIKVNEVLNLLEIPPKLIKLNDSNFLSLFYYYDLLHELELVNGKA